MCRASHDWQDYTPTSKSDLEVENNNLKFWFGYLDYRLRNEWRGASGEYITMDIENILIKIKNEIRTKSYAK